MIFAVTTVINLGTIFADYITFSTLESRYFVLKTVAFAVFFSQIATKMTVIFGPDLLIQQIIEGKNNISEHNLNEYSFGYRIKVSFLIFFSLITGTSGGFKLDDSNLIKDDAFEIMAEYGRIKIFLTDLPMIIFKLYVCLMLNK